mgnify:CR=1 FL=1
MIKAMYISNIMHLRESKFITKKIQNIQTLEIFKSNIGKQWNLLNTGISSSKNHKNNTFPFMGHKFHCATILGSFM